MARTVIISFETDIIKVIYATRKKKGFVIDDALRINDSDFDSFLAQEKTREFIVTCSFSQHFTETILIPPVHKKHMRPIINNEVRKLCQFKEFSFVYTVLGEKTIEKKPMQEIFVYAVNTEMIRSVVDRFTRNGKAVRALYPDIFAAAAVLQPEDHPVLGVLETGLNKNLLVVKNGKVQFIRVVQAFETGMRDHDIQNINMTVNYCRQTMKVMLSRIVLLGSLCSNFSVTGHAELPLACFTHPLLNQKVSDQALYREFFIALSALFVPRDSDISLLPGEYTNLYHLEKFVRCAAAVFLVVSLFCVAQSGLTAKDIFELRTSVASIRKNLPDVNTALAQYRYGKENFSRYEPFLESYQKYLLLPDNYRLLYLLSRLTVENIDINSIRVSTGDAHRTLTIGQRQKYVVEISGSIASDSYGQMQTYYQRLLQSLLASGQFVIESKKLDIPQNRFYIQAYYQ